MGEKDSFGWHKYAITFWITICLHEVKWKLQKYRGTAVRLRYFALFATLVTWMLCATNEIQQKWLVHFVPKMWARFWLPYSECVLFTGQHGPRSSPCQEGLTNPSDRCVVRSPFHPLFIDNITGGGDGVSNLQCKFLGAGFFLHCHVHLWHCVHDNINPRYLSGPQQSSLWALHNLMYGSTISHSIQIGELSHIHKDRVPSTN